MLSLYSFKIPVGLHPYHLVLSLLFVFYFYLLSLLKTVFAYFVSSIILLAHSILPARHTFCHLVLCSCPLNHISPFLFEIQNSLHAVLEATFWCMFVLLATLVLMYSEHLFSYNSDLKNC